MQVILAPILVKSLQLDSTTYEFDSGNLGDFLASITADIYHKTGIIVPLIFTNKHNQVVLSENCNEEVIFANLLMATSGRGLGPAIMIAAATVAAAFQAYPLAAMLALSAVSGIVSQLFLEGPLRSTDPDDFESSPTYNYTAFSNQIGENNAVQLVYGITPVAPVILDYEEDSQTFTYKQTKWKILELSDDVNRDEATTGSIPTITAELQLYESPRTVEN